MSENFCEWAMLQNLVDCQLGLWGVVYRSYYVYKTFTEGGNTAFNSRKFSSRESVRLYYMYIHIAAECVGAVGNDCYLEVGWAMAHSAHLAEPALLLQT